MGLFSFLGDAAKKVGGFAIDIAKDVVPGGSTVIGIAETGIGLVRGDGGGTRTPQPTFSGLDRGGRIAVDTIGTNRRFLDGAVSLTRDLVTASAGPSGNPGTNETQPFQSFLDTIRAGFERNLSGIAQSFGRDVAMGAAAGAEAAGGVPVTVGGNKTLLLLGGLGLAAVVGVIVVTR